MEDSMRALLIAIVATASASIGVARAQDFPSHPITMIVPLPAGSAFDLTARLVAERMRIALGQPVIVENLTGASGSLGTGRCARSKPDGYTLCFGGVGTHVLNGAMLPVTYDALKDFEPVALLATAQLLIVAKKSMPADDLRQLIAWLKANPNAASQGTGGTGSLTHLAGVLFERKTGTQFRSVPYRGAAAAVIDLVAGHIDFMIDLAPNSLPHVHAGAIKVYAVMAKTHLSAAPQIPTVDEAGLPGFYMSAWQGLWVPKGTPSAAIARLNGTIVDALADPTVRARLAEIGQDTFPRELQTPGALGEWEKAEIAKLWPVIRSAAIKSE
jgi:tripartite-type tricarboxylate transporter receptor subunit TctC